jgi:hypothetical protein
MYLLGNCIKIAYSWHGCAIELVGLVEVGGDWTDKQLHVACRIPVQRVAAYAASNDIRRLARPPAEKRTDGRANNRTTQIAATRLQCNRPSSKQVARALSDMARPAALTRLVRPSSCSQRTLKLTMDQRPTDVFRSACSTRDGLRRR